MAVMRATVALLAVCLVLGVAGWAQATPPGGASVIAGPIPQNVTDTQSTIWWETSGPASAIVKYGTDPNNLDQMAQQPWGEQSHSVKLSSLRPNTTYYYQVQRASGEVLKSGQFHTQPSGSQNSRQVRIIDGPRIEFIGQNEAVIAWTTNVPSSAIVRYGTSPNSLTQTAEERWGQATHRVAVRSLRPNATYYFTVQSGQAQNGAGAVAQSQPGMFQTSVGPEGLKIPYQR